MKRIYVAGPYTNGDVAVNVREACQVGLALIKAGYAPFVPHLSHFLHYLEPQPYETWTTQDFVWLPFCHALLRLPGESSGADAEVDVAKRLNIPVYASLEELMRGESV